MPTHCCVPLCTHKGYKDTKTGEKISFFCFPKEQNLKRRWLHAIRREEKNDFKVTTTTKVCSRHFETTDMKKSLAGIVTLKPGTVPSKFSWTVTSNKRKAPTTRPEPTMKVKKGDQIETLESIEELSQSSTASSILEESELNIKETLYELKKKLEEANTRIQSLESENTMLKTKLSALEVRFKTTESRVFTLEHFTEDEEICYYTGFPNYQTFLAVYNFLDPGEKGENIRYNGNNNTSVDDDFYNQADESEESDDELLDDVEEKSRKRGRSRALKPIEEVFLVLCRLRRGFCERHLGHLYGISQSTVSRTLTAWFNYMYLKFSKICIWPSREKVDETMPECFREKYPTTRVIIDCTEIRWQMPSSLLLNSELFSSYKNHVTLKGLVGISPSGAMTFISQMYPGNISDKEIVSRSGLLDLEFEDNDTIMADKGFTIDDILPLGVNTNIPPFLGDSSQMSGDDVVKTQQIASLRIHIERAINKIKNFHVWDSVVPLSLFGVVNQMWTVCAFLCNMQDPIISV
ncbi:uncharacterized protein LOC110254386 [Exaiptasia diaphana]|uniref:THAP-type domain-containing protein n=1 Tax=Exaiptasia diaphana TaxID=2652724 RepID=A0A913Y8Z7_EXADI|nr:uncharacterized protein LOC110254386 [Exaiptasia diaphana]